jgi:CRP-like cAMP-binding protein
MLCRRHLHAGHRIVPSHLGPGDIVAKTPAKPSLLFDPAAFLEAGGAGRTITTYRKGEQIFSQGSASEALFYLIKGKVKILVLSEQGKEAVIAVLEPNDFFGEGCLTGQPRRLSAASAITECEILRIGKSDAMSALRQDPAFSEIFVAHVLARTIRVEADLIDQLFNSSEKRLARALLLLANFGNDGEPKKVVAKVSQEMLASMIGTTRSRVSHFMNKFRKLGFIEYNGHLEVHNSLLNVVLHEQPHISDAESAMDEADPEPD